MLYIETPDDKLEAYTKERCDEIRKEYDDLKRCIVKMMNTEDELEMFNLVTHISQVIGKLSYEHVDTLDRYLYAYESSKRLSNKISALKSGS